MAPPFIVAAQIGWRHYIQGGELDYQWPAHGGAWEREVWHDGFSILSFETVSEAISKAARLLSPFFNGVAMTFLGRLSLKGYCGLPIKLDNPIKRRLLFLERPTGRSLSPECIISAQETVTLRLWN